MNKYLEIGTNIAEKYEVIDVLGEDDFEILYLVRDIDRKGSFFVLKELFLETFSSREGQLVFTIPQALGVFHKRKKQIIEEIKSQKINSKNSDIKIYGYEDENNTIYTIMEFSSNASLEKYLHFVPKGAEKLPTLKELLSQEKKTFNGSLFLKILLFLGFLLAISFYAYKFFQKKNIENQLEQSVTMEYPVLKDRTKENSMNLPQKELEENEPIINIPMVEEVILEKYEENITLISDGMEEIEKEDEPNLLEELSIIEKDEENMTLKSEVIAEEKNLSEMINSQDTMNLVLSVDDDINTKIKGFLEVYIDASATSVESSLKFYDKHLKRYFKFRNASHKTISKSQKRYNKKWVNREFKILHFEIIKSYKRENISYVDVKTITEWNVSNIRGKKATGKSRGFMTLKEVENSFKITSIYTLK
jgi:hypothetical protein